MPGLLEVLADEILLLDQKKVEEKFCSMLHFRKHFPAFSMETVVTSLLETKISKGTMAKLK